MKKRWGLFVVLVLLLIPTALAAEQTLYDDDAAEGEEITVEDITYTIYEYADYTGVRLSSNDFGSIIIEETGGTATQNQYTYTLNDVYEGDGSVYFSLTITSSSGDYDIELSRSTENYNPVVGEEVEITITIESEEGSSVDITYEEDLPNDITLIGDVEVTKGSSTQTQQIGFSDIYYSGTLDDGEIVTIVFTVEVDGYPSDDSGVISFDDYSFTISDDYGDYDGHVDPFKLTIAEPVSVSIEYDGDEDANVSIGDERRYYFEIDNGIANSISVEELLLEVSSGIDIVEYSSDLEETTEGLLWSGTLDSYDSQEFYVIIETAGGGEQTLDVSATYIETGESETLTASDSASYTIDVTDLDPKIVFNSGGTYDGGEAINIQYIINNSDGDASYNDEEITISTDSGWFETLRYVVAIPARSTYLIKEQDFVAPYSDEALSYTVTMVGEGDASFTESDTFTISASTFTVPYAIEYTVLGTDETYTNVSVAFILLSQLTDQPTSLAVSHTHDDYKKTLSLTTEQITTLFSEGQVDRTWDINILAFTGDEVTFDTQLQYEVNDATYYKSGSIALPIYEEVVEEEEIEEDSGNLTVDVETTTETNTTEANATVAEEETLVISGEKEETAKKWVFFILILVTIVLVALSLRYYITKKQKEITRKRRIEQISGQETNIVQEEKTSFFQKAKDIVVHDVPTPEQGYEKLHSYMLHAIQQGKTNEDIKNILVSKGWLEEVVDSWLARLR